MPYDERTIAEIVRCFKRYGSGVYYSHDIQRYDIIFLIERNGKLYYRCSIPFQDLRMYAKVVMFLRYHIGVLEQLKKEETL